MLADQLDSRNNGLNAIRLILAITVLFTHSWPLSGHGAGPLWKGEAPGPAALLGFFAISGYLITGSRLNLSAGRFVWHRFLRIYPGYWAVLTVTAFGFAPLISILNGEHWTPQAGLHYLRANLTTRIHDFPSVPGTLLKAPYGSTGGMSAPWNGSTWTLYYELSCYIIIGLVLTVPFARRNLSVPLLGFVAASIGSFVSPSIANADLRFMCELGAPFAAGVLLRLMNDRVPMRRWLVVTSSVLCLITLAVGHFPALGSLPMAYLVLWCGSRWKTSFGRRVDLSYGVYIYAFPVQQMMADLDLSTAHPLGFALVSLIVTLPFAWCSWHLVERQALRAKSWTPMLPWLRGYGRRVAPRLRGTA